MNVFFMSPDGNFVGMGVDNTRVLGCPNCGEKEEYAADWDAYTHLEMIYVAGRNSDGAEGGDGSIRLLKIRATTGEILETHVVVSERESLELMPGDDAGRRDRTVLVFSCEMCHGAFGREYRQHKGVTYVELHDLSRTKFNEFYGDFDGGEPVMEKSWTELMNKTRS